MDTIDLEGSERILNKNLSQEDEIKSMSCEWQARDGSPPKG